MPSTEPTLRRLRIAVFASGRGTTFAALADAARSGLMPAEVVLLIASRAEAPALGRAEQLGIASAVADERIIGPAAADAAARSLLQTYGVELVVLAGYLRKIGPRTLAAFTGRIVNTHPAPLPRFGGKGMYGEHVHRAVLESGVTASAASVHLVDAEYDTGLLLAEASVPVLPGDTVQTLQTRVQTAERQLLIDTIADYATRRPG